MASGRPPPACKVAPACLFRLLLLIVLGALISLSLAAHAQRVKDLANVAGARTNQLIGYGLVVGLDGTGDQTTQTPFTQVVPATAHGVWASQPSAHAPLTQTSPAPHW